MAKDADGNVIKVGMVVGFKSDIEQEGVVIAIDGRHVRLENEHGFSGDYIGGMTQTTVDADRCWIEE